MDVLASTFFVKVTVFLKPADPLRFRVFALDCNVKKNVKQDLHTKRIVNFASFFAGGPLLYTVINFILKVAPANKLQFDLSSLMIEL